MPSRTERRRVVVTGADGFIARNLRARLAEVEGIDVLPVTRADDAAALARKMARADVVFHLAGASRPADVSGFAEDNVGFTRAVCDLAARCERPPVIVFSSSVQAALDNPYGTSKRLAEEIVAGYGQETGARFHILRLANVFGKGARPDYNSVVATICRNAARGLPPPEGDAAVPLRLVYIDDVVEALVDLIDADRPSGFVEIGSVHEVTLGEVVALVAGFAACRRTPFVPRAGSGLARALHATFLSYLEPAAFAYNVPVRSDARGDFVEMLKTGDFGQVSCFTARPGVTRGGHFHHTKTERFVVVSGTARFRLRNVDTGETFATTAKAGEGQVLEIPPGWAHDVTNVGEGDLVCVVWANEDFDPARPDTVPAQVVP
ncbi:MAG TPA: SDR family oxidoreductase [Rhizobiales bacterium]|nr:SDR family oxidoreductase [Hyphomicrobiales bacterium]